MSHAENCQGKYSFVSSRFFGDADWSTHRCPVCMGGYEAAGAWSYDHVPQRRVFRDGTSWCVTGVDFTNLAESPAGFGDTQQQAADEYARQLNDAPNTGASA